MDKMKKISVDEIMVWLFFILIATVRCFHGIDLTDGAYHISDALAEFQGNYPFAYNTGWAAVGQGFLLIPFFYIYQTIHPQLEGLFLACRLYYIFFAFGLYWICYRLLLKRYNQVSALLLCGYMMLDIARTTCCFSYNNTPYVLAFFVAIVLWDTIEHTRNSCITRTFICGFIMGIAVLAHAAYGLCALILTIILFLRSDKKWPETLAFISGGLTEIILVLIGVIAKSGLDITLAGLRDGFFPYYENPLAHQSLLDRIIILSSNFLEIFLVLICIYILLLLGNILYQRYTREMVLDKSEIRIISVLILIVYFSYKFGGTDYTFSKIYGMIGSAIILIILANNFMLKDSILMYVGIYPIMVSLGLVLVTNTVSPVNRFVHAAPTLGIVLFLIYNNKQQYKFNKILAFLGFIFCFFMLIFHMFSFIYRDDNISLLKFKVERGIYQGIFTTKEKAKDICEIEDYLNNCVSDGELYAFRDLVPFGYLMVRKGEMCDIRTWDSLQYFHYGNTPANLYAYYKRKMRIPDKIIYVDFGIHERLSVEDDTFLYNDFIKAYYNQISDICINQTFKRVIVYQYNGKFDGNYDVWIEHSNRLQIDL